MPTVTSKLKEIQLPSVVGWEWSDTYHGDEYTGCEGTYKHQIIWLRGRNQLFYITKPPGREWSEQPWVTITRPERFGFDNTLDTARSAAEAFYAEGSTS